MSKTGSRVKERRDARERQRQRQRQITIAVGLVLAAVVLAVFVFVSSRPADVFIPEEVTEKYDEISKSVNQDGFPRLGEASAPVTLIEYSSFSCPACEVFHSTVFPALLDRIESGQINFTFVPLQTGSIPNPGGAARAALCSGLGAEGEFWATHDILFDWHTRYGNTAFTSNRLAGLADSLSLSSDSFNNCFNSAETDALLLRAQQQGVASTPTLTILGTRVTNPLDLNEVLAAIDAAYAPFANQPLPETEPTTDATEEAPAEVTAEAEVMPEAEMTPEAESTAEAGS